MIAAKPDILVSAGPQPIAALKSATATIPIVMAIVSDPVTYGFAQSLAHPGGNLTGMSMVNTELSGKRIELLREVSPEISRIAVFTDPTMGPQGLPETSAAARALNLDLQVLPLAADKIEQGFVEAQRGSAQALLVMPTPFYNVPSVRQRLATLALRYRLPSMCEEVSYVRDGCMMSYGPDFSAMWRHSAFYVDKILKGVKPADLPIEQPTKFEFFINLAAAKGLGLAWLGLAWLGLAWLGLAWLGLAWLGLAWLGLAWLGLAWLGYPATADLARRRGDRVMRRSEILRGITVGALPWVRANKMIA